MSALSKLAKIYERSPTVCSSPNQVRTFLRTERGLGKFTKRMKDFRTSLEALATKSRLPALIVRQAESDPDHVCVETLRRLAKAHGKEVAIVFYDKEKTL